MWKSFGPEISFSVTIVRVNKMLTQSRIFLLFPNYSFNRTLIRKWPQTLIIHMKRFQYDEKFGTMRKLNYKIAFPLELKIAAVNHWYLFLM